MAPSDGRRVYALIEAEKGGLFRSDDGGENWTLINDDRRLRQRAWYYSTLTVSPANPDEVWFPQVPMLSSIDGGKTVARVKGPHHGDHHDLWIDPKDPKRMINGNDGGVDITIDGGETWFAPPLPIGQLYHVSVDSRVPFQVAGSLPGHRHRAGSDRLARRLRHPRHRLARRGRRRGRLGGLRSRRSRHRLRRRVRRRDHPLRPPTGEVRNVSIYPDNSSGHGAEDLRYRFQWTAPIAVSPHDPTPSTTAATCSSAPPTAAPAGPRSAPT